jgi:hypothetical protein
MRAPFAIAATACALAMLATASSGARAEADLTWCAMSSINMGTQTCSFASLDQCRACGLNRLLST